MITIARVISRAGLEGRKKVKTGKTGKIRFGRVEDRIGPESEKVVFGACTPTWVPDPGPASHL